MFGIPKHITDYFTACPTKASPDSFNAVMFSQQHSKVSDSPVSIITSHPPIEEVRLPSPLNQRNSDLPPSRRRRVSFTPDVSLPKATALPKAIAVIRHKMTDVQSLVIQSKKTVWQPISEAEALLIEIEKKINQLEELDGISKNLNLKSQSRVTKFNWFFKAFDKDNNSDFEKQERVLRELVESSDFRDAH